MVSGDQVDKEIIFLRGQYEREMRTYDLFEDAIPIGGREVRFMPYDLFDGRVRVWLPEDFTVMPERIARVRYITEYRPPVIWTNDRYDEDLCFYLLGEGELQRTVALDALVRQMQDTILFHAPETVMYDQGSITSDKVEGRWFDLKGFTLDEEAYSLYVLIHAAPYLLIGVLDCPMMSYEGWKRAVLGLMGHVEVRRTEEGEG